MDWIEIVNNTVKITIQLVKYYMYFCSYPHTALACLFIPGHLELIHFFSDSQFYSTEL